MSSIESKLKNAKSQNISSCFTSSWTLEHQANSQKDSGGMTSTRALQALNSKVEVWQVRVEVNTSSKKLMTDREGGEWDS